MPTRKSSTTPLAGDGQAKLIQSDAKFADDLGQGVIFLAVVVRQILRLCMKKEIVKFSKSYHLFGVELYKKYIVKPNIEQLKT